MSDSNCINCGRQLARHHGTLVCLTCNSELLSVASIFTEAPGDAEHRFIECPGATQYKDGTNEVEAGAKFLNDDDPALGFEIVDHPMYAPEHKPKRRIKAEAFGHIRRCRACQDLTVRLRRREGPDFVVPSPHYPGRKKLKPAKYRTFV